jgi:hypothetical protein
MAVVAIVVGVRVARAAVGRAAVSRRAMRVFVGVRVAVASRMSGRRRVVVVWRRAAAVAAYRRRRDGRFPAASWRRRSSIGTLDGWGAVV